MKARWKIFIAENELLQKDVAKDINMTESRLSLIVKCKAMPNPIEYYKLAKYLGVKMEDCYFWEE